MDAGIEQDIPCLVKKQIENEQYGSCQDYQAEPSDTPNPGVDQKQAHKTCTSQEQDDPTIGQKEQEDRPQDQPDEFGQCVKPVEE
jgi:hypothetical protein